MAIFEIKDDKI